MSPSSSEMKQKEQFSARGNREKVVQGAHFRECDKFKQGEKSFSSDDGLFSQGASLFILYEVRIDWSTAEWNIKK